MIIYFLPWIVVGLFSGIIYTNPDLFSLFFAVNIWGLSVPHTFSTFTRKDLRKRKWVLFALALFIFLSVLLYFSSLKIGLVFIYTFYFFWQQFHYSKQNLGIGVCLKEREDKERLWDTLFFHGVTLVSLLGIFHQGNVQFFGYELINPFWLHLSRSMAFSFNILFLGIYLCVRFKNKWMAITHVCLFSFAYLYLESFALGWLMLNIFHNTQYLIFMKKEERSFTFLAYAFSATLVFFLLLKFSAHLQSTFFIPTGLSIVLLLSLSFTHYFFDGIIWQKKMRELHV